MTKSTGCLPDVNVWLALASRRHAHASRAAKWMDSLSRTACFCRVTQAALLRLLTNPAVMGAEVLDASRAWGVYDEIRSDSRVEFAPEPVGLESEWRRLTGGGRARPPRPARGLAVAPDAANQTGLWRTTGKIFTLAISSRQFFPWNAAPSVPQRWVLKAKSAYFQCAPKGSSPPTQPGSRTARADRGPA